MIVDDGSTDNTAEVASRYGNAVRYFRQANAGQAAAFNRAFTESTGEVICFLDADDIWEPCKIRRVVETFSAEPKLGLVHHRMKALFDSDAGVTDFRVPPRKPADGDVSDIMRLRILPWMFSPTSGLSLRRELGNAIFPLTIGLKTSADQLIAPIASLLAPVRFLEEPLGSYRIHGSNLWSVSQRRLETSDARFKATRYVSVMEEKTAHANQVLRKAGQTIQLSPFLRYKYIDCYCQAHSVGPLSCLPEVFQALNADNGWKRTEILTWVLGLLPRILTHYLRY